MSSSALDHDILKQVFQSAKVYKTNQTKARTRAVNLPLHSDYLLVFRFHQIATCIMQ